MDQEVVQILKHIDDGHHFLLSGGAGSGKTYTLVQVIKEVLNKYHFRIACMTYTNAAANEIEQRVNHRDLNVSTIHDFLWDNIKNYQSELKQAVIALLNDPECKMHLPDSEEFVADDFFDNRENPTEIQYKEYLKIREGIISHDEVLMVANYMFANHKRLCDVVKSRYPFIFIDEYQDTHPEVIAILLEHINKSEKKCIVGFFGDSMQAIYDDGIGDITKYLYNETTTTGIVYEIQKAQNRRCPLSVIQLANKLRNDGLEQQPSNDPKAPNMDEKGHVKQGSTMFYYSDEGINNLEQLKENLIDEGWDFNNSEQTKELRLTHNLIAYEAGFASLMDIHANDKILDFRDRVKKWITENDADYDFSSVTFGQALDWLDTNHSGKKWKPTPEMEKYIECHNDAYNIARSINFAEFNKCYVNKDHLIDDKAEVEEKKTTTGTTLSPLNLHLRKIETCIRLYQSQEYSEFMRRTSFGFITSSRQKKELKDAIDKMTGVEDMTIGEVISMANKMNICKIDDKLEEYMATNRYVYERVSMIKYNEFRQLYSYLQQQQPFSTQHKTKGLEYNDVLVILNNTNWRKYDFESLFNASPNKKDSIKLRTRKLFYVCCTRAKNRLAVYYPSASLTVIQGAKSLFGDDNVIKI